MKIYNWVSIALLIAYVVSLVGGWPEQRLILCSVVFLFINSLGWMLAHPGQSGRGPTSLTESWTHLSQTRSGAWAFQMLALLIALYRYQPVVWLSLALRVCLPGALLCLFYWYYSNFVSWRQADRSTLFGNEVRPVGGFGRQLNVATIAVTSLFLIAIVGNGVFDFSEPTLGRGTIQKKIQEKDSLKFMIRLAIRGSSNVVVWVPARLYTNSHEGQEVSVNIWPGVFGVPWTDGRAFTAD